jgi:hypothetical protein
MRAQKFGQVAVERTPGHPAANRAKDGMHERILMAEDIEQGFVKGTG